MSGSAPSFNDSPPTSDVWAGEGELFDRPPATAKAASRKSTKRKAAASAAVAEQSQASFDFTESLPDLNERGNYTMMPNEIYTFGRAHRNSGTAMTFLLWLAQQTYGGQYEMSTWGEAAKALRARGLRPKWYPLTLAKAGEVLGMDAGGAGKILAWLEHAAGVLVTNVAGGRVWYAIDWERMRGLPPMASRTCTRRPRAEESNIPNDAPMQATETPSADPVPQSLDKSGEALPPPAAFVSPPSHALNCVSQPLDDSGAPVASPGTPSSSTLIGLEVQAIRVRNVHGTIISAMPSRGRITSYAVIDESLGRVIDFTTDAADSAELIEGPHDRITLADLTERLNDLLADKFGEMIPPRLAESVYALVNTGSALFSLEAKIKSKRDRMNSWFLLLHEREGVPAGLVIDAVGVVERNQAQRAKAAAAEFAYYSRRQAELEAEVVNLSMSRDQVLERWRNAAQLCPNNPEVFRRSIEQEFPEYFEK